VACRSRTAAICNAQVWSPPQECGFRAGRTDQRRFARCDGESFPGRRSGLCSSPGAGAAAARKGRNWKNRCRHGRYHSPCGIQQSYGDPRISADAKGPGIHARLSAGPTGPGGGCTLVDEAAAAIGGWAVLDSVKSQEIITGGADVEPLQAVEPTGQPRVINQFGQDIVADFAKNRMRLSFDAIREYPSRQPVKFVEIVDSDGGMVETSQPDGKT